MQKGLAAAEPLFQPNYNMSKNQQIIDSAIKQEYEYGFTTDIEQDTLPPGLNHGVIRFISAKKKEPDRLLDGR